MKKLKTAVITTAMAGILSTGVYAAPIAIGSNLSDTTQNSTNQLASIIKVEKGTIQSANIKDLYEKLKKENCIIIGSNGITEFPDIDISNWPDNIFPDYNKPDTDKPGTDVPDIDIPDNEEPDGEIADSSFAAEVVRLVNIERVKAGLPALTSDVKIQNAALIRAKELKTKFSHTRPDGSSCFTALQEAGIAYRNAGENIASGQKNPQEVMKAWMNSSGHRENILKSSFGKIGVGYYEVNGTKYWVQMFTN